MGTGKRNTGFISNDSGNHLYFRAYDSIPLKMRHKSKGEIRDIGRERIKILLGLAEQESKKPGMGRARRYAELARKIAMRYQIELPREYKRRICKKCGSFLVFGKNATVRTLDKAVSIKCGECGNIVRVPFTREVAERRRLRMADRICGKLREMKGNGIQTDEILKESVRLIRGADSKFNWTRIYILRGDLLELHNYIGRPTEHTAIKSGVGVCGAAVAQKRNINVPDVSKVQNYLACSVETKSEIVVLIRAPDGRILGQIDIDSDKRGAFREKDEKFLQRIAECIGRILA